MPHFSPHIAAHLLRLPLSLSAACVVVGVLAVSCATASGEESISYERDVRPILKRRCFACHGALKQEAELRLDAVATMLSGGDSGAAIQRGNPMASLLVERISLSDELERMPPEGEPLSADEIANIRQWIEQGAVAPTSEESETDPRLHWAFQPPQRADVPSPNVTWIRNPIDAFIAAQQMPRDLTPVREVESSLLLRRVYLDLIGLPPTRQQQQRFLANTSSAAYDDVVEELLLSPHHGERWGRHWMDVWRYSDWYGLGAQLRNSQKHIWHWRDWIVESLNKDKGYDQMVMEMLAADEIAPTDHDALRATGFLARNYYLFNRTTWLDNTIEHTSKSLLGLTLNCAKCHDHKFDPLLQDDYYRMRAVFEPHQVRLDPLPGETDLEKDGLPRVFDAHPDEPTYVHIRGDEKNLDTSRRIEPGVPTLLAGNALPPTRISLPLVAHRPELQPFVLADQLGNAEAIIETKTNAVAKAERTLASARALKVSRSAKKDTTGADGLFLHDEFDEPNSAIWETGPGMWKYEGGRLVQSKTGASRHYLRSRADHPADFTARFKFKITGGDKWRSVGLCFDVADGREKLIYLSAVAGGSKLQVSYKTGPNHTYPPNAKQDRPVVLHQLYDVQISVRGTLINVAIDGQHALAYDLPVPREAGKLDLIAFDATAEFHLLDVRQLSKEAVLVAAGKPSPPLMTVAQAQAAAQVAHLELAAARSRPVAIRTAQAADIAKCQVPPAKNLTSLVHAAAVAARKHEAAVAESNLAKIAAKLEASAEEAQSKNEKELKQARQLFETARAAIANPGDTYTSLRVSRKALEGPAEKEASRNEPFPNISTGRRTALARWIVNRDNPLTARVAVNHIWARHFGQPLVDAVFDFGLRSPAPPQQILLDWLAVELMEHNWSHRHIHRLIVTSHTYRLATMPAPAGSNAEQIDPDNHFYWRRKPLRMESQVIRDSLLQLAGVLDLKLGGPSMAAKAGGNEFRRSLYFKHSRDDSHPFLSMFDDANILACYRRSESIVPQQALTLANSKLSLEMARQISATFGTTNDDEFVTAAFETMLCRLPSDQERSICLQTLVELTVAAKEQKLKTPDQRARANLIHALINHNDFITIR